MSNAYRSIQKYLDSLVNYEKVSFYPYKDSLKLKRVFLLFEHLKIPYKELKAIHVAGTKGKGSTAYMCSNLLAASGLKVGLYTSPHISNFRERIIIKQENHHKKKKALAIKSELITKKDLIRLVKKVKGQLKNLEIPSGLGKVSFFEVYTAIAIKYFLEKKVDIAIIETGLGGRLDATNIIYPLVSVITHIGYDHTDKLGNKLKEIAYEKAGIIKSGIPVVCADQRREVLKVIQKVSKEKGSPLFILNRDFQTSNVMLKKDYTIFNFAFNIFWRKRVKITLKGRYQIDNAALALAVVYILKEKGFLTKIKVSGINISKLEGRFEIIRNNPLIILDIAHNLSSFSALAGNLKLYFPKRKIILVFACSKDKDPRRMLRQINYDRLILTRFNNPRSMGPLEIKKTASLKDVILSDSLKDAFREAVDFYEVNSLILVSGSLFLVSEAKEILSRVSYFRKKLQK